MGLFFKKPTATDKKEANAALSRMKTCFKKMETGNSIDSYFTTWQKYTTEYELLKGYEQKGVKLTMSSKKMHLAVTAEVPRIEKETVQRGYDRLQRDMAKLSTDAGKAKKANAFFSELEFYYPRLKPSTVEYIQSLRASCPYMSD